jgi:hypothetical protein
MIVYKIFRGGKVRVSSDSIKLLFFTKECNAGYSNLDMLSFLRRNIIESYDPDDERSESSEGT